MPSYIDKDKLVKELKDYYCFFPAIVRRAIEIAPVEDVVPKEYLEREREYSKFLKANLLEAKRNTASDIFEEIEKLLERSESQLYENVYRKNTLDERLAELKKKYIGEEEVKCDEVKCKDCKHLMFSDFDAECSKGYRGIVRPNDTCPYGEKRKGE